MIHRESNHVSVWDLQPPPSPAPQRLLHLELAPFLACSLTGWFGAVVANPPSGLMSDLSRPRGFCVKDKPFSTWGAVGWNNYLVVLGTGMGLCWIFRFGKDLLCNSAWPFCSHQQPKLRLALARSSSVWAHFMFSLGFFPSGFYSFLRIVLKNPCPPSI